MIKQNTPEWEQIRKKHLGASDAPVVMEVSPWKTPFQLWEEKLGLRPAQFQTAAMSRGHDLEAQALQAYNDYTGNAASSEVVFHPDKKWMMASLDGLSLDRSTVVEIKCPGKDDHFVASKGKVPEKYYPQLQHQLAVIGLNLLHYFSYSESSFHLVEVERDDKYIQKLYAKEECFWQKVLDFDPPNLTDKDFVRKSGSEWEEAAARWAASNAKLKEIEQQEKAFRQRLIELAENQSCQGGGIQLQKVVRRGAVDYSGIPQIAGIDLDKYRKPPVETWRLKQC